MSLTTPPEKFSFVTAKLNINWLVLLLSLSQMRSEKERVGCHPLFVFVTYGMNL